MNPILLVVGARPNFMKIAPLHSEIKKRNLPVLLLHTGQHYDEDMSKVFFDDLGMPEPDIYLGVGSASHAKQTAKIMIDFEEICIKEKPSIVVVAGDVNSTIACALVATKLSIPVGHVEAGLRSFDMNMPEEINRILTDRISNLLFTPSKDANENLINEGMNEESIKLVGNIMIDSLLNNIEKASASKIHNRIKVEKENYSDDFESDWHEDRLLERIKNKDNWRFVIKNVPSEVAINLNSLETLTIEGDSPV